MKKGYKITLLVVGFIVSFMVGNFLGFDKATGKTNEILQSYDKGVKDHFNIFHKDDKDAQIQADLITEDVKKLVNNENN